MEKWVSYFEQRLKTSYFVNSSDAMTDLSVIIVNYNVKHFLEQCLYAVTRAAAGISCEILVIDNQSTDGSMTYLPPKFPGVKFIENTENTGFARACNQGLERSAGRYILFLNPDTIVPENCFRDCMTFLAAHPEAGALGTRMVDGSGRFLKESKRAFPSPMTSLYKLSGLSKLFPHSKIFSRYHLGHLPENQINEVDVLAGAFMMIKKEVLDKTGGFDEDFFMYGEDVDLSYRIQQAGYRNYYYATCSIIHFKGESTRKGSMNYVRMFYTAMIKFVRKHYGSSRAGFFTLLIYAGIWLRAGMTAIANFIRRFGLPLIDAGLILLSFWIARKGWNNWVKPDVHYENRLFWIATPSFTVFYLIAAYYAGLYDRWYKRSELVSSTVIATLVLLAAYALLPEQYRFSRAIIFFGALIAFILISFLRWALIKNKVLSRRKEKEEHLSVLVTGSASEYREVQAILKQAGLQHKMLGRLGLSKDDKESIGYWKELKELSRLLPYKEIIYCSGTLTYAEIISSIQELAPGIRAGIFAAGSSSIVISESGDMAGESVSKENGMNLANPYHRRLKRLADIMVAVLGLLIFPFQFFIQKKPLSFLGNCLSVLVGRKTWIGYSEASALLPDLRQPVIASNGIPVSARQPLPRESLQMMDYWYARDFEVADELRLIWKVYRRLGE